MRKIKVLFEAGPMLDGNKSGVGYYVKHLITNLGDSYDNRMTMNGYFFDFLNHNNKQIHPINNVAFFKVKYIPGKLLSLCRRLKFQPPLEIFVRKKSDIVLFTNYVSLPSLQKRTTALVIYDLSFLDHPEYLQTINLAYLQKFCPPSIQNADIIITISEFTKARLLHHFPDIKAAIVITPIPPSKVAHVKPLNPRLLRTGITSKKYILYLGTVEPRKNIQNLVRAYASLPKSIQSNYSLVIAGGKGWKDGEIMTEIEIQKAKGLKIIQTGYISDTEKTSLYAHSSCFVLPSHYEGFGMPILEAMQYGSPVAVSDIPVFHEVASNAALYFDKDSPKDIAATIEKLLTDQKLQESLAQSGREHLKTFSWEHSAEVVYQAFGNHTLR